MSDKKIDFEASLNMLEDVIKKLESGDCSLDESIKLFELGMKYSSECRSALDKAEKRIAELSDLEREEN